MDDNRSEYTGGASRPPRSEDTPLFTEDYYTPIRRTANSGRPNTTARPSAQSRPASNTSNYGGRAYTSAPPRNAAPSRNYAPRPNTAGRNAPMYTELSWDDLNGGGRPAQPQPRQAPQADYRNAAMPNPRSQQQYFGGFDREMDELFYNRNASRTTQNMPAGNGNTPYRAPQPRQPMPQQPARNTNRVSPQPRQTPAPRPTAPRNQPPQPRRATPSIMERINEIRNPTQPRRTMRSELFSRPEEPKRQNPAEPSMRPRARKAPPVFLAGMGALLVAMIVLIVLIFRQPSSSAPTPPQSGTVSATMAPVSMATAVPEVTPEADPDATPVPTPEPTPTPTGPKARQLGNLVVSADWGPVIPTRAKAVYDSYFDKSIMIGNSLVEGFFMYSGMTNIRYVYKASVTVNDAMGTLDLAPITLNASGYYDNIYLMFGLNEIGTDVNSFVQGYKKLVDYLRQYQPDANVIIISVTPIMKKVDEDPNEVQSMERIRMFNAALQEFCVDQNCWYLDVYSQLLDDEGFLSLDYAYVGDGKHFEKSGYVAWANYMKTHYVDAGLLTE